MANPLENSSSGKLAGPQNGSNLNDSGVLQQPMGNPASRVNPQDSVSPLLPHQNAPATRPGGVGSIGNATKPFKL
jgi:hypothetical protein